MKPNFEFPAGVGVIRAKKAPSHVILFGQVCVPAHGQCWLDGVRDDQAPEATLTVKRCSDRKVVGTLVMPTSGAVRKGHVKLGRKKWAATLTLKTKVEGEVTSHHLVVRLDDVKPTGTGWL